MALLGLKPEILHLCWITLMLASLVHHSTAVNYKVTCSPKFMVATIELQNPQTTVYLDRLKGYPVCQPKIDNGQAIFELSLEDIYSCGTTRVYDRITGRKIYYHTVVMEASKNKKDTILIKCDFEGEKPPTSLATEIGRPRRNVLPDNFTEAVDIEKIATVVVEVPAPMVHVSVRQNELPVDTQVNVQPGTPLLMEISLDKNSSVTYGLFVKDIKVTDNSPNQEEIIMQNGCSVDPYLFTNFVTDNGDYLTAKFRAFKFPDSSYVLFIGTVNVCLQICRGVPCSNGQTGYGRRRREVMRDSYIGKDPNKIFEITMTTIMRVGFGDKGGVRKDVVQSVHTAEVDSSPMQGAKFQSDNSITVNTNSPIVLVSDEQSDQRAQSSPMQGVKFQSDNSITINNTNNGIVCLPLPVVLIVLLAAFCSGISRWTTLP